MGNSNGIFADDDSYVISQILVTAQSNTKSDLNVIVAESNQLHSTNVFLRTQATTNSPANPVSAVTLVGQQTIGAGVGDGSIQPDGNPGNRQGNQFQQQQEE
jgi:hypothetical protein